MEELDIKNVIACKGIKEYKTGFWKAQLNLLENNKYMVEIYWFNYPLEKENQKNWYKIYDNENEAEKKYQSINLKTFRRILNENIQKT